jgi:hypothetical protein
LAVVSVGRGGAGFGFQQAVAQPPAVANFAAAELTLKARIQDLEPRQANRPFAGQRSNTVQGEPRGERFPILRFECDARGVVSGGVIDGAFTVLAIDSLRP